MNIPFRIKLLTPTAFHPMQENPGDLWDLRADTFSFPGCEAETEATLDPGGRVLVGTGLAIELPVKRRTTTWGFASDFKQLFQKERFSNPAGYKNTGDGITVEVIPQDLDSVIKEFPVEQYAVADIRPRSGLALKHGITVLNTPGTIDNSYRKEIGVILINHGNVPYTIKYGDKIAQMLIRPLYQSSIEIVKDFEDTGRGGFGSTGN